MILSRTAPGSFARPIHTLLPQSRKRLLYTANGVRPRLIKPAVPAGRRQESSEVGDNESGHIETRPNEGILFFDSECREMR